MSSCEVDGCDKKHYAKGMCFTHYQREWRKVNDPALIKPHAPVEVRFWRFVEKTADCWIWTGGYISGGYGVITVGGRSQGRKLAHRLSYEMHHGPIPEGYVVMHKCDNPKCVNPEHLGVGTQSENIMDAVIKKRMSNNLPPVPFGEKHPGAKLTAAQVLEIRQSTLSVRKLGVKFGVSPSTIQAAKKGDNWRKLQ